MSLRPTTSLATQTSRLAQVLTIGMNRRQVQTSAHNFDTFEGIVKAESDSRKDIFKGRDSERSDGPVGFKVIHDLWEMAKNHVKKSKPVFDVRYGTRMDFDEPRKSSSWIQEDMEIYIENVRSELEAILLVNLSMLSSPTKAEIQDMKTIATRNVVAPVAVDEFGRTFFHNAAKNGQLDILEYVLTWKYTDGLPDDLVILKDKSGMLITDYLEPREGDTDKVRKNSLAAWIAGEMEEDSDSDAEG